MTIHSLMRHVPRVLACAAVAVAAVGPARAVQVTLPSVPVQIVGAESLCTSFSVGGTAGAPVLTCVTGTGGSSPFSCALTGAPTGAVTSGSVVTLVMSCSGGTTPYSYSWTGGSTGASLSVNPTATTTYNVSARDSANGTSTQSATVTVSSGGGNTGGAISCQGFNSTTVLDLDWNNPLVSARAASLSQNDAVVVRLTTTAGYGKISAAEFGGISAGRYATLSTSPCDFSQPPPMGWGAASYGNTVEILFSSGANPYGYAAAPPGPLYFNLKTTGACGTNCGMPFQLNRY